MASALGCAGDPPAPADAGAPLPDGVEVARALVEGAPLPSRIETVAIADRAALASMQQRIQGAGSGEVARYTRLAADLRARLWRFDQTATDAREAIELYVEASRLAAGTEEGCDADRQRALVAGELARDGAVAYRELYLTSRRQSALLDPAGAGRRDPGAASACLADLDRALALAIAYRPSGASMRTLEREATNAADAAVRPRASASASASAAPEAPSAAAPSAAPSAPAGAPTNVVVAPTEAQASKGPVKLTSIEPYGSEQSARVVLHLSAPTTFQVGTLAADGTAGKDARIFLDIARASAKGVTKEIPVGGVVRRVRVGAQEGGTRVVLDLGAQLYRRIFYLPDPFRIVIDVSTRPPMTADKQGTGGAREIRRVAIDPGHGGNDSGAVGPTGLREKDVTLDIAHRVAPLLAHELKVETLLTRDSDVYVPLDLRTARANAFHADLFVSIHCNASENPAARGVQSFVLDEARDPEGFAARVAARENAQRRDGDGSLAIAAVLSNLNLGDMVARSRHVADLLQRSALASLAQRWPDTKDQGVKTAGFFVLVGADMPAVLFESAFISNTDDEARLATADYRQKLADVIANAIKAYKQGR